PEDVIEVEDTVEPEDEIVPDSVHEIASLSRRLCGRETAHALVEKKEKAKDNVVIWGLHLGMLIPAEILKAVLNFLLLIIITLTFEEDIQSCGSLMVKSEYVQ
nr:hypothetical protein [Tanacetum cinerariifolium]